ncbi:MAG: hypothetical protein QW794_09025 [Thermosphaera sp.]
MRIIEFSVGKKSLAEVAQYFVEWGFPTAILDKSLKPITKATQNYAELVEALWRDDAYAVAVALGECYGALCRHRVAAVEIELSEKTWKAMEEIFGKEWPRICAEEQCLFNIAENKLIILQRVPLEFFKFIKKAYEDIPGVRVKKSGLYVVKRKDDNSTVLETRSYGLGTTPQ